MAMDLSYHKNTNIYMFLGWGPEQFLRYKAFYESKLVSLDASYHNKHEYIYGLGVGI